MSNGTHLSFLCHRDIQVRLEWPTDLAINPMDNSIYVLDNNVVLQITENRQVYNIDNSALLMYWCNFLSFLLFTFYIILSISSGSTTKIDQYDDESLSSFPSK